MLKTVTNIKKVDFDIFHYLDMEHFITKKTDYRRLNKYKVTGFEDSNPKIPTKFERRKQRFASVFDSKNKKLQKIQENFEKNPNLTPVEPPVPMVPKKISKEKYFEENPLVRKSKFENTLKAVMKFKSGVRQFVGWELEKLPTVDSLLCVNSFVLAMIIKVESKFWFCSMTIAASENIKDNPRSALEDFNIVLKMVRQKDQKEISISMGLGDLSDYVKFPRIATINYITRRIVGGVISSKFERKFLKILQVKLRNPFLNLIFRPRDPGLQYQSLQH